MLLEGAVHRVLGGDECVVAAEEGALVEELIVFEFERGVVGGDGGVFEAEVGVVDEEESSGL